MESGFLESTTNILGACASSPEDSGRPRVWLAIARGMTLANGVSEGIGWGGSGLRWRFGVGLKGLGVRVHRGRRSDPSRRKLHVEMSASDRERPGAFEDCLISFSMSPRRNRRSTYENHTTDSVNANNAG
ncbi:hypothetical protein [Haladaptatus halobius]|uniref:hypothetical protein n=1 Tax=Haladaptatus halobius TaxID=2884875 RepID=UPI001D0A45B1|nr:hypothetical protein [Haladaptatus halobius]